MLKEISAVIMVPSRRIPVPLYAGLQILAAAPTAVVYHHVCQQGDHASSGLQAIVLVLIWVNFCIMANRFHDAGVSGLWLLPLFALGTGIYLVDLDPVLLGKDWATHDLWSHRLDFAKRIFALMGCTTAAIAVVAQATEGRNRYGMPLGEKDWTRGEHFLAKPQSDSKYTKANRLVLARDTHADTTAQIQAMRQALKSGGHSRSHGWH